MPSRHRKSFPPGTFIPTPQRMMAIGQLCIAFSLLLWYAVQPFMGEYFTLRSRMLLYEYVMGTSDFLKTRSGHEEKLERQAGRFKQLPEEEKAVLHKDYQQLQEYAKRPIFRKILDGFRTLMLDIPPFEQAWIFFSITIAILLLLKVEGAQLATWLLPLIILVYTIDNQLTGKVFYSPDSYLFPTEKKIIRDYLKEPLSASPMEQREQLEVGWKRYLIDQWSTATSTSNEKNQRLEEAEFQFTLARLHLLHGQPRSEWLHTFHQKLGAFTLLFFLVWNILFAWAANRSNSIKNIMQEI
jgi:hypothetical protein